MAGNPSNYLIEGRMANMADIQRTWMWQLLIPGINEVTGAAGNIEDLVIRCRSIDIPPRTNNPSTSSWMAMRQFFPGRPEVGGTVSVTFEETEDLKIRRMFWAWEQNIINLNYKNQALAGKSSGLFKRQLCRDMFLVLYGYNGIPLRHSIRFHNAWVQNTGAVALNYDTSDSVKYTVAFQYDFWSMFPEFT